ncbi:MAG: type IV secretion system protein [Neisseriaceae bacterium]
MKSTTNKYGKYKKYIKYILPVIAMIVSSRAYAGKLDTNFVLTITNAAAAWAYKVVPAAKKAFMILWFFETMLQGFFKQLFQIGRIKELLRFVLIRTMFLTFFTGVLMDPDFYLGIIQFLARLGGGDQGSGIIGINAGDVWANFVNWYQEGFIAVKKNLDFSDLSGHIILSAAFFVNLGATVVISFLVIMVQIEVSLIVYGALILTSCAGSDWTKSWWNSYLGGCVSLGLKVMIFCFLYTAVKGTMVYKPGATDAIDIWTQVITCVICTLSLWIVPARIAGMVSSAGSGNFGGELVAGFMGGIAMGKSAIRGAGTVASVAGSAGGFIFKEGNKVMDQLMAEHAPSSGKAGNSNNNGASQQPIANAQDKAKYLNNKGMNDGKDR